MNSLACISRLLAVCVLSAALTGCSDDVAPKPEGPGDGFITATLGQRIEHNNEFAFKLYEELSSSGDNLLVSPHSIATTFGMAYAGARGTTEKEIADVLCFNYPQDGFHSVLSQLNNLLVSREGLELNIANGCWGRDGETYLTPFLDTLSVHYGAELELLDFAGHPEESRETINQWVSQQTEGLITGLIPPGSIDWQTYLVLANAVYFSAEWLRQFEPAYTYPAAFTLLDGSEVQVQMMRGEETFPYYEGKGYTAVELPYKGEAISMVLILPDEGNFAAFEASFDAAVLDKVVASLEDTWITVQLPKFSFLSDFDLIPTLKAMGMTEAFEAGGADFSGMDGTDDGAPWISVVAHKAFISLDEFGTLAAAGTGMVLTKGLHDSFHAVRPFILAIRDNETGTILFLGRVLNPNA